MMNKGKFKHILGIVLVMCSVFNFSSCVEDDWFYDGWWDDGGWADDRRTEEALCGRWYLDYCEVDYGDCPYYESDEFNFYGNGRIEIIGDRFYERGKWYVEDRRIYFDLDRDGHTDMVAYIDKFYRDYVTLDIKDYMGDSRYYLELVR